MNGHNSECQEKFNRAEAEWITVMNRLGEDLADGRADAEQGWALAARLANELDEALSILASEFDGLPAYKNAVNKVLADYDAALAARKENR